MFAYGIFKVIYAPYKALKEIAQKPKYLGPLLIMILFIVANVVFIYDIVSKSYVEQSLPAWDQDDVWTENSTLWTTIPGVTVTDNFEDYINGTIYGNRSIEFSTVDSKQISMQLDNIGPVNCSGPDGYSELSFRLKWVSPPDAPENVTIYLFSSSPSDYFSYNLTGAIVNSTNIVWNNVTLPLNTVDWSSNGAADWGNITGLKLELAWNAEANLTVRIDGLFFHGFFVSELEGLVTYITNYSLVFGMQFIIRWVLLTGIIYVMVKAFGGKIVWKPALILIGSALITLFVQSAINAVVYSTLPPLYYGLDFIGGVPGEFANAYNKIAEQTWLVSQISSYVQIAIYVWTIALCAVATRLLTEFSWAKSVIVSTVAFFASVIAIGFLGL